MTPDEIAASEEQHREEQAEATAGERETFDDLGTTMDAVIQGLRDNAAGSSRNNSARGLTIDDQLYCVRVWVEGRATVRHCVVDDAVDPLLTDLARMLGSKAAALSAIELALVVTP